MKLLKKRMSKIIFCIFLGTIYSLLTIYIRIPISSFLPISPIWNRKVWLIITWCLLFTISLYGKIIKRENMFMNIVFMAFITFLSGLIVSTMLFLYSYMTFQMPE